MLKIKRPKPIRQISSGLMIVSVGFLASFMGLSYLGYGIHNHSSDGHVLGSSTSQPSNSTDTSRTSGDKSDSGSTTSKKSSPKPVDPPATSSTAPYGGRGGGSAGSTSVDPIGYTLTVSPSPTDSVSSSPLPTTTSSGSDSGSSSGSGLLDPVTTPLKKTTDTTLSNFQDTTDGLLK